MNSSVNVKPRKMSESEYLNNPDLITSGFQVDTDEEKWLKICRALKEAGKQDCFYFKQGESIIGKDRLKGLLGE